MSLKIFFEILSNHNIWNFKNILLITLFNYLYKKYYLNKMFSNVIEMIMLK